ncbi:MAG: hypothetical protein ACTSV5_13100 [Promethearchaeota archaeon]
MTEILVRSEKCPICDVKIEWDKLKALKTPKGTCPNCGRDFRYKKIRFL